MFSEAVKKVCNHFKDKDKHQLRSHKFYNQIKLETSFLSEDVNINQRFWHILNNTKDIPKCLECGIKEVKWHLNLKMYHIFCSRKCCNNNLLIKNEQNKNRRQTFLNKYSVDNPTKSKEISKKVSEALKNKSKEEKEEILRKQKQTNLDRYGVNNPMKSKRFQDKLKQTNIIKYGVDNPTKSKKISKKISSTLQNKSEDEKEEIKNRRKKIYQNKSEKEKEEINKKRKQTNLDKYGVENTKQKHLSKDSLEKLKDPKYLEEQHYIKKKNLTEIAKELGLYGTASINKYFHKYNISILTHPNSFKEKEIISYIKNIYKKDFPTNTRKVITPLELDIYLEDLKLAVEFNGTYWHSSEKKSKEYHFNKIVECYKKKVKLINIYEYEWDNYQSWIKYWLKKYIDNNLDNIITKDIYLKDIADKNTLTLSLNWPINYELLKQNNFKFKENLEPNLIKINNYNIYDAGKIILEKKESITYV